jgi:hypothetical protein
MIEWALECASDDAEQALLGVSVKVILRCDSYLKFVL